MQKRKYKAVGKPSYSRSFMWVFGFGHKKQMLNQDGDSAVQIAQTILPFCVIESAQVFKRVK